MKNGMAKTKEPPARRHSNWKSVIVSATLFRQHKIAINFIVISFYYLL